MTDRITKFEKTPNSMFPYKLKDDSLCTELDGIHKLGLIEDLLDQYNVKDLKELDKLLTMATSYEELSKQIGCPLDVVFIALANGIYVEDLPSEDLIKQFGLKLSNVETEWYLSSNVMCVNLKDYKKCFWLRKDKSE